MLQPVGSWTKPALTGSPKELLRQVRMHDDEFEICDLPHLIMFSIYVEISFRQYRTVLRTTEIISYQRSKKLWDVEDRKFGYCFWNYYCMRVVKYCGFWLFRVDRLFENRRLIIIKICPLFENFFEKNSGVRDIKSYRFPETDFSVRNGFFF